MAILIYTSANSDPINTRVDGEADLSGSDTLPLAHDFYVVALDSNDPSAVFTYQWYIAAKPSTSSAVLVNDNTDTVTLDNVDVWGNHRLFCVAQNVNTGEFSESDILKAPNASFVNLNVLSPNAVIEKPAKGERNWYDKANVWAQRIEDLYFDRGTGGLDVNVGGTSSAVDGTKASVGIFDGDEYLVRGTTNEIEVTGTDTLSTDNKFTTKIGLPNQVIIGDTLTTGGSITSQDELTVTNDTNLNGDIYLGGSINSSSAPYVNINTDGETWFLNRDLNNDGTLDGNCEILTKCDPPTETERGAPLLQGAPSWTNSPDTDFNPTARIANYRSYNFNSTVEGTIQVAQGATNYNISDYIESYSTADAGLWPHIVWRNHDTTPIYARKVTVLFHDVSFYQQGVDTPIALSFVESKAVLQNSWTNLQGTATWVESASNHVIMLELELLEPVAIDAGAFFGIIVLLSSDDTHHPPVRMSADCLAYAFV